MLFHGFVFVPGERVHEVERGCRDVSRGDCDGLHPGGQRNHVSTHKEPNAGERIR